MSRRLRHITLGVSMLVLAIVAWVAWLNLRGEAALIGDDGVAASPELIARGAYLARAGNCAGCHTAQGGAAYAGGRGLPTPFGTVYAPNLTPDPSSGLGRWSRAEFWRAMHHGRSRDGHLLYPAFPYPNYTQVSRDDADALLAYLRSLAPVARANTAHALQFPFDQQAALAVWRALYFRAGQPPREDAAPAGSDRGEWARGAYLVEGLGHCNACHASRNALGATAGPLDLAGGMIPVQHWYAPSLASSREAGVADWSNDDVVHLLQTGLSPHGAVMGPMSEVVRGSTQYLSSEDLHAVAIYLKALPQTDTAQAGAIFPATSPAASALAIGPGAALYERHCAGCHGEQGEGASNLYPALAGNRAVMLPTAANLVHLVLEGGFAPATAGNPRPFGMPPFETVLSDDEIAALLTTLRSSWGNRGEAVSAVEVALIRGGR